MGYSKAKLSSSDRSTILQPKHEPNQPQSLTLTHSLTPPLTHSLTHSLPTVRSTQLTPRNAALAAHELTHSLTGWEGRRGPALHSHSHSQSLTHSLISGVACRRCWAVGRSVGQLFVQSFVRSCVRSCACSSVRAFVPTWLAGVGVVWLLFCCPNYGELACVSVWLTDCLYAKGDQVLFLPA